MLRRAGFPFLLLPLAALLALYATLVHGVSAGQDLGFHTLSWLDAATQLRHGHYPQWATTPAWNAGEPRFVFYPPLSWMCGALLTLVMPITSAIPLYLLIVVGAAGLAMYRLAQEFVEPTAAMLAAALYLANPYLMFCALERSAMAELMATIWLPLLLLGILRVQPTVRGIAVPLALLWLTNAPAAVIGSYTLALLAIVRVAGDLMSKSEALSSRTRALRLGLTYIAGAALGLTLPAFYLVPAAYERRYVQVAMAIIPNMRFQDNFLFAHTADAPHNAVNRTASLLALSLLGLTVIAISAVLLQRRWPLQRAVAAALALLTAAVCFLLVPLSTPVWQHLPNLAFLQFPWRWLMVLAVVLSLATALLLDRITMQRRWMLAVPLLSLLLGLIGFHLYDQPSQADDNPRIWAELFRSGHGAPPTDEYTPADADNDQLRINDPAWWLTDDPNAPAPNTLVNPATLSGDYDTPIPPTETLSQAAPRDLRLSAQRGQFLVLNLRDYPDWNVSDASPCTPSPEDAGHITRDDGLIAFEIECTGDHLVRVQWRMSKARAAGLAVSVLALLVLVGTFFVRPARVESI